MVVAEEQPLQQIESEIGPILRSADSFTTTMYIISLGKSDNSLAGQVSWFCYIDRSAESVS